MLPYTPLHHLILRELDGVPLVMTSGNASDEPIAYRRRRRGRAAGGHRRRVPDPRPADPSPLRRFGDADRRGRGAAAAAVARLRSRPARAAGAVPCAHAGARRSVEGDLRSRSRPPRVLEPSPRRPRLLRSVSSQCRVDQPLPGVVRLPARADRARSPPGLRDNPVRAPSSTRRSPGWPSSITTRTWPVAWPTTVSIEPVIGVAFDGTGFGTDGAVWGGEFLTGDYRGFRRAAHFRYVAMPGGEQAIREPWRMAAAYLADAGQGDEPAGRAACPRRRSRPSGD